MNTEELIIQLIEKDMKHQQLVEYICKAGFETDMHNLDMAKLVAKLMDINEIPDRWIEIYINCLGATIHYPITGSSDAFTEMAKECYMLLKNNMP